MTTYEVNLPKSDNYTPTQQHMMAEGYALADSAVKHLALALYHRVVMASNHRIELTDPSIEGIYELVDKISEDVDLVDDVCPLTHKAMMSVSRVYSYSEGVMRGGDILEVVCELVGEYLTEKIRQSPFVTTDRVVECYFVDKEEYIQVFIYDEEDEYTD